MKIFSLILTIMVTTSLIPSIAHAADIVVNADMQKCVANEDCLLVSNDCKQSCGFLPVNKATLGILEETYATKCGKPMEASTTCEMTPPLKATCINARCTIDAAYKETSTAKDYQTGAYGVPEAAEKNKVSGDFTKVNDRDGKFSAYNLPQEEIKQKTVGQIFDKIYVPADAPVKGDQYTTVTKSDESAPSLPKPAPTPVAPAPVAPAVATPATTAPVVPATVTEPTVAVPSAPIEQAKPLADMPVMTPTKPNQMMAPIVKPAGDEATNKKELVVPPAPQPSVPPQAAAATPPALANPVDTTPRKEMIMAPEKPMLTDLPDPTKTVNAPMPEPVKTTPESDVKKKGFSAKTDKKDSYNLN